MFYFYMSPSYLPTVPTPSNSYTASILSTHCPRLRPMYQPSPTPLNKYWEYSYSYHVTIRPRPIYSPSPSLSKILEKFKFGQLLKMIIVFKKYHPNLMQL